MDRSRGGSTTATARVPPTNGQAMAANGQQGGGRGPAASVLPVVEPLDKQPPVAVQADLLELGTPTAHVGVASSKDLAQPQGQAPQTESLVSPATAPFEVKVEVTGGSGDDEEEDDNEEDEDEDEDEDIAGANNAMGAVARARQNAPSPQASSSSSETSDESDSGSDSDSDSDSEPEVKTTSEHAGALFKSIQNEGDRKGYDEDPSDDEEAGHNLLGKDAPQERRKRRKRRGSRRKCERRNVLKWLFYTSLLVLAGLLADTKMNLRDAEALTDLRVSKVEAELLAVLEEKEVLAKRVAELEAADPEEAQALEPTTVTASGRANCKRVVPGRDRLRFERSGGTSNAFLSKPQRSTQTPYLLVHPHTCRAGPCDRKWEQLFTERKDICWVGEDLGDHKLYADGEQLVGVTIPAKRFFKGKAWDPQVPAKYKLSFSGACNSKALYGTRPVRTTLGKLIKKWSTGSSQGSDMFFKCESTSRDPSTVAAQEAEASEVMASSSFTLVPRGERRWTGRLTEAIGACSIPVIIADGLTLPYEQLLDWSSMSIRIKEDDFLKMKDLSELLGYLPKDAKEIMRMRLRLCAANDAFLKTTMARQNALYIAAGTWIRQQLSGLSFAEANPNCKDPLRMC